VAKRPVQIMLDDDLIRELHGAAKSASESMSLIVRTALRAHFRKQKIGVSQ
jgi:predicted transcriptional regulator